MSWEDEALVLNEAICLVNLQLAGLCNALGKKGLLTEVELKKATEEVRQVLNAVRRSKGRPELPRIT